jgi:UDP-glucose 4-epimerase
VDILKWHPANKLSMIHHQDIASALNPALTGAMDGPIVNTVDEAPTSVFERIELVGATMEQGRLRILGPATPKGRSPVA